MAALGNPSQTQPVARLPNQTFGESAAKEGWTQWQVNEPSPWDKPKEGSGNERRPPPRIHKFSWKHPRLFNHRPSAPPNGNTGFTLVEQPNRSWDEFVKNGANGEKQKEDISSMEKREQEESDRDFAAAVAQMDELALRERERLMAPHQTQSLESTDGKILAQAIMESMETYKTEAHHRQGEEEVRKGAQAVVPMEYVNGGGSTANHREGPAAKDTVEVMDPERNHKRQMSQCRLDPDLPADFNSAEVEKSSDESYYDDDGEQHTEKRPLGRGWQYATYLGSTTDPNDPEKGFTVEMWDVYSGFRQFKNVAPEVFDQIKNTTFLRFKNDNNGRMKIAASRHLCARATAVKVRPGRSVEIRTTAVVAFTHDCNSSSIPIWCDPVGWLQLDITKAGVLRRGTERDLGWSAFKPLKIIELTVKVRIDINFLTLQHIRDGIVISDVVQVAHVDKNGVELPSQYFPQAPKRFYNLRLLCTKPNDEGLYKFDSKRHPALALWAYKDQFAYQENMKYDRQPMTGVFVKVSENQYRALIVGPVQVIMYNSKDRIFDYRRYPVARKYEPPNTQLMEMIKAKGTELEELEKEADQNKCVFL